MSASEDFLGVRIGARPHSAACEDLRIRFPSGDSDNGCVHVRHRDARRFAPPTAADQVGIAAERALGLACNAPWGPATIHLNRHEETLSFYLVRGAVACAASPALCLG